MVQRVLKSISAERRLKGLEVNWTNLLGQIMTVCNSHTGTRSLNTSSYQAVFGQRFHPVLRCTVSEMRECVSLSQCLRLSPDERLEKLPLTILPQRSPMSIKTRLLRALM